MERSKPCPLTVLLVEVINPMIVQREMIFANYTHHLELLMRFNDIEDCITTKTMFGSILV